MRLDSLVRLSSMGARALFVLQLLLGILILLNIHAVPLGVHQTVGIIFVLLVWFLGYVQATKGGSFGLGLAAILTGAALDVFGLFQVGPLATGPGHIVAQVVHVLLAIAALGLAEMCTARYRRSAAAAL